MEGDLDVKELAALFEYGRGDTYDSECHGALHALNHGVYTVFILVGIRSVIDQNTPTKNKNIRK